MRTKEQVAKESVGMISAVRRAILKGDDKTVKAAEPIVTAIIKTGLASPIQDFPSRYPRLRRGASRPPNKMHAF